MGTWTTWDVAGHACHVFRPESPDPAGRAVLYLHGVHVTPLQDHPAMVEPFDQLGLYLVAPVTGATWWLDRVCPEFDTRWSPERYLLDEVLAAIRDRLSLAPPRLALFGTSMGGQGALRIAYKHPRQFNVVAALAPAIDFQLRWREGDPVLRAAYPDAERARQETATLYIHPYIFPRHQLVCCDPADTRWWESSDRLRMKLQSLGVPCEFDLETSAGGHGFGYYTHMAARAANFLARGLSASLA